jgi:hypothetical protein
MPSYSGLILSDFGFISLILIKEIVYFYKLSLDDKIWRESFKSIK